jgi:hypothetical protein
MWKRSKLTRAMWKRSKAYKSHHVQQQQKNKFNWFKPPKRESSKRRALMIWTNQDGKLDSKARFQLKDSICFKWVQIGSNLRIQFASNESELVPKNLDPKNPNLKWALISIKHHKMCIISSLVVPHTFGSMTTYAHILYVVLDTKITHSKGHPLLILLLGTWHCGLVSGEFLSRIESRSYNTRTYPQSGAQLGPHSHHLLLISSYT